MKKSFNKAFKNGREPFYAYWNWQIALYHGDDIVATGTIKEIAERRNIQKGTVYRYCMPIATKRNAQRKNKSLGFTGVVLER